MVLDLLHDQTPFAPPKAKYIGVRYLVFPAVVLYLPREVSYLSVVLDLLRFTAMSGYKQLCVLNVRLIASQEARCQRGQTKKKIFNPSHSTRKLMLTTRHKKSTHLHPIAKNKQGEEEKAERNDVYFYLLTISSMTRKFVSCPSS